MNLTKIRDELSNIKDILYLCRLALQTGDIPTFEALKISNALYFQVINPLEILDEELKKINQGE